MGGQSIDDVPLDIPIHVISSPEDMCRLADYLNVDRERCVEYYNSRVAQDKEALSSSASTRSTKCERQKIVTPGFKLADFSFQGHYEYPDHYIKTHDIHKDYVSPLKLSRGEYVHYDITKEDLKFLNSFDWDQGSAKLEEAFVKIVDQLEKATAMGPAIQPDAASVIYCNTVANLPMTIYNDFYSFWLERRYFLQKPLLRMFWGPPGPNIPPPYCVFQTKLINKDRMALRRPRRNQDISKKTESVASDFGRVEKILNKMLRRDKHKLLIAELNGCIFDQIRNQIRDPTYVNPYWTYLKRTKSASKIENWVDTVLNLTQPPPIQPRRLSSVTEPINITPFKIFGPHPESPMAIGIAEPGRAYTIRKGKNNKNKSVNFSKDLSNSLWIDYITALETSPVIKFILADHDDTDHESLPVTNAKIFEPPDTLSLGPPDASLYGAVNSGKINIIVYIVTAENVARIMAPLQLARFIQLTYLFSCKPIVPPSISAAISSRTPRSGSKFLAPTDNKQHSSRRLTLMKQ